MDRDGNGSNWMRNKDGNYVGDQEVKVMEILGKEKRAELEESEKLIRKNAVEEGLDRTVTSWRSLFTASSDQSMNYFPPQQLNGKMVVSPPKEVFEEGEELWKNAVVAQFIGRIPNFSLF